MSRLSWLILRSWLGPFVLSFSIILFILVLQFMTLYQDDIFGKGLTPFTLLQLFAFAAAKLVIMAAPVAVLAASLMTFGSMGEHYELAATKACGISLWKTMRPMMWVAMLLTGMMMWFSFELMPMANLKFFRLLYDVQKKKADFAIKPGIFYTDIDNYVIRAANKNPVRGILYDVLIYDYRTRADYPSIVLADSAKSYTINNGGAIKMVLYHGNRHEDVSPEPGQRDANRYSRIYFDSLYYQFTLEGFDLTKTDEGLFKHQITARLSDLKHNLDSIAGDLTKARSRYQQYLQPYTKIDTNFTALTPTATQKPQPPRAALSTQDQIDVLSRALNNARSVKNYAEFMHQRESDDGETLRRYTYEYHKRFVQPLSCLFFMLIGISLGAMIRKGGIGVPALVSIVFMLMLYIFDAQGRKFAKDNVLDPALAAWVQAIVFAPLSLIITWQATQDVRLFDNYRLYQLRMWIGRVLFFWKK